MNVRAKNLTPGQSFTWRGLVHTVDAPPALREQPDGRWRIVVATVTASGAQRLLLMAPDRKIRTHE